MPGRTLRAFHRFISSATFAPVWRPCEVLLVAAALFLTAEIAEAGKDRPDAEFFADLEFSLRSREYWHSCALCGKIESTTPKRGTTAPVRQIWVA